MDIRLLGKLCIVFSGIAIVDGIRLVLIGHEDTVGFRDLDTLQYITQTFWIIGIICGLIGLISLKATGSNPIFRMLSYLPILGWTIAIVGLLLDLAGLPKTDNPFGLAGEFLGQGGMLVLAILVIAAKSWVGWRRFTPLFYILSIPLGGVIGLITGLDGPFIIVNAAATAVLGYAVLTSVPILRWNKALA